MKKTLIDLSKVEYIEMIVNRENTVIVFHLSSGNNVAISYSDRGQAGDIYTFFRNTTDNAVENIEEQ